MLLHLKNIIKILLFVLIAIISVVLLFVTLSTFPDVFLFLRRYTYAYRTYFYETCRIYHANHHHYFEKAFHIQLLSSKI